MGKIYVFNNHLKLIILVYLFENNTFFHKLDLGLYHLSNKTKIMILGSKLTQELWVIFNIALMGYKTNMTNGREVWIVRSLVYNSWAWS